MGPTDFGRKAIQLRRMVVVASLHDYGLTSTHAARSKENQRVMGHFYCTPFEHFRQPVGNGKSSPRCFEARG